MVAKCIVAGADLGEWRVPNGWAVACVYLSYDYARADASLQLFMEELEGG